MVHRAGVWFAAAVLLLCYACLTSTEEIEFTLTDGVSLHLQTGKLYSLESICDYRTNVLKSLDSHRESLVYLLLLICGDVESCPGPAYFTIPELIEFKNIKGLTICHQNVRDLASKRDILSDIFLNHSIDIFCTSETWQAPDGFENLEIRGYNLETKPRNAIGGGIAIYLRNEFQYTRRSDIEPEGIEIIWIEVSQKNARPFLIGVIYRPPDSSKHLHKNVNKIIEDNLKTVAAENKEYIILGDINCNYLTNCHKEVKRIFNVNGCKQLIKSATRVTSESATLIDVILTNRPANISSVKNIPSSLSDHDIIACKRKINHIKYLTQKRILG